ncbi:hypothetical protein BgAZ_502620 [Babesia gibsoni]|uniref:Uncharacterized protein n=1 Tax=Babesia gibsoni TaxID=33632 RepID=A0AAD8P7V5_BABGI|nr:hypothetical protein BgAZ_502620 [Babesia gibsoni]
MVKVAGMLSPTQEKTERLLSYLAKKIGEHKPHNIVFFIVDILCTYYPHHIPGFAKVWLMDKGLEEQKQHVRDLFKRNNSSSAIAQHFINAGFDNIDVLATLNTDILDEIQAYNNTTWLPGHKVKVFQIFADIQQLVKEYKDEVIKKRPTFAGYDAAVYKRADGSFITTQTTTLGLDGNAAVLRQPVYYYPKVQTAGSLGGGHTVTKVPSNILEGTGVTLQQLATISAEAATTKVLDDLMAKAEENPLDRSLTQNVQCCYPTQKN